MSVHALQLQLPVAEVPTKYCVRSENTLLQSRLIELQSYMWQALKNKGKISAKSRDFVYINSTTLYYLLFLAFNSGSLPSGNLTACPVSADL